MRHIVFLLQAYVVIFSPFRSQDFGSIRPNGKRGRLSVRLLPPSRRPRISSLSTTFSILWSHEVVEEMIDGGRK
jgi:hypothetical protein